MSFFDFANKSKIEKILDKCIQFPFAKMKKNTYIAPIFEPETFITAPKSDVVDGKRSTVISSTADGKLHGTSCFVHSEFSEIADLIKRGKRVRINASSLCRIMNREDLNSVDTLVDATSWKRGTILFDPTPTEVRSGRSIADYGILIVAAAMLAIYSFVPKQK